MTKTVVEYEISWQGPGYYRDVYQGGHDMGNGPAVHYHSWLPCGSWIEGARYFPHRDFAPSKKEFFFTREEEETQ